MSENNEEPLNLDMGTKERAIWEDMKKATLKNIESYEKILLVDKAMLELCDRKIEEEKKKFEA